MASWKEERDRLVAQTLAFVQHVAAAHPAAANKLGLGSPKASANVEVSAALPAAEAIILPDAMDVSVADGPPRNIDIGSVAAPANILADLPARPTRYATVSERLEITQRVAAFKARQVSLHREREAYYDSVQARIRSSLRNDNSSDRL